MNEERGREREWSEIIKEIETDDDRLRPQDEKEKERELGDVAWKHTHSVHLKVKNEIKVSVKRPYIYAMFIGLYRDDIESEF